MITAPSIEALPYQRIGHVDGLPLNWKDEQSGALKHAVFAYFGAALEGVVATEEELELVLAYIRYYLAAPCWMETPDGHLAAVRRLAADARPTLAGIGAVIEAALDMGLDPL